MDSDYSQSGFDKFLSKGDNPSLGGSLDNETVINNSLSYDRTQVSGQLGDILQIGNIIIDGRRGKIIVDDGNERVLIGKQTNEKQGIAVSKEGFDADANRPNNLIFDTSSRVLKVVWSLPVQVTVPMDPLGNSPLVVTYFHNLNALPIIFGTGTSTFTNGPGYYAFLSNNFGSANSLGTYLNDMNSFTVAYDSHTISDTQYNITYYALVLSES